MNVRYAGPPRILLIDDNLGDVRLITEALGASVPGAEIRSITDGAVAIGQIRRAVERGEAPHLVLLDLQMPKKSGLDILAEIRKGPATAHLPVVILTSSEAAKDVHGAYALHANSVVTKPLGFLQLRATIQTLCEFWLKVANLPETTYHGHPENEDPAD
jgi:chemotaxis family two-component system response regulator Rcp1